MRADLCLSGFKLKLVVAVAIALAAVVALGGCSDSTSTPDMATAGNGSAPAVASGQWWNDATFYEVFVRSFYDSDGDGNGDLNGLVAKLDYLNDGNPATTDDLGITGLWLMPVLQSPSYHGYDAVDYYTVEEDYGSNQDFQRLIQAAHERGIKVIVDLMLNHTSNQHPWFVEAASDPNSPLRTWYVWRNDDPRHTTPWGGQVWFPWGDSYYHSIFWEGMPDLNYRNPAVTEEMYAVARFWLEEMGVDGFRLDAVRHLIEKDAVYVGTPETHQWLVSWDDFIDQVDSQALTVGEVWDDTAVVAPYVTNDEVDLAFEFDLAEGILRSVNAENPFFFADALHRILEAYPPGQFAPFLTNHDQNRAMTQLGGEKANAESWDKARLAATALLTLPGVPFLYYGEEIGMTGAKPDELIRTPMQWSAGPNAGFTSGTPWEPVNRDFEEVNVAAQSADPGSLLSHYRQLIHVRNQHPALRLGAFQSLQSSCRPAYGFLRQLSDADRAEALLVVLNFSGQEQGAAAQRCTFDLESSSLAPGATTVTDLLTGDGVASLEVGPEGSIAGYAPLPTLGPRQGLVLLLQPE